MRTDAATKEYVTRRQGEGKNRKEIIRCLKRHIAREIYRLLTNPELRPPTQPAPTRRASPSPKPPKPSEPTPPASQNSNEASTTTTPSLPDTRTGSEPTNPPRHRFDNRRSILGKGVRPRGNVGDEDLETRTPPNTSTGSEPD